MKFEIPRPIPPLDELVQMYRAWWAENTDVPYGYCWCGCGEKTTLVGYTAVTWGTVRNQPRLFLRGHVVRKYAEGGICDVDDCTRPRKTTPAKGGRVTYTKYCSAHWAQKRKGLEFTPIESRPDYVSHDEAMSIVQSLEDPIKSEDDYVERWPTELKHLNLPRHPYAFYKRREEWVSFPYFCGKTKNKTRHVLTSSSGCRGDEEDRRVQTSRRGLR